jgi:hypothetical protein
MNERTADSVVSAKERAARIRAEAAQHEREQAEAEKKKVAHAAKQDAEARKVAVDDMEKTALISSDETREHLLERVREMRNETTASEPPAPPPLTAGMQEALSAEQAAGRAAVAKVEAEQQRGREMRQKVEAEERERLGTMAPVHHPNPGQNEVFPANKATLGKR